MFQYFSWVTILGMTGTDINLTKNLSSLDENPINWKTQADTIRIMCILYVKTPSQPIHSKRTQNPLLGPKVSACPWFPTVTVCTHPARHGSCALLRLVTQWASRVTTDHQLESHEHPRLRPETRDSWVTRPV